MENFEMIDAYSIFQEEIERVEAERTIDELLEVEDEETE